MKNILSVVIVIISLSLLSFNQKNDTKDKKDKVSVFLIKMYDARMMDREEGKLAVEKGTTKEIRDYGNLMIKDQSYLIDEIKNLSKIKNITLPSKISDTKLEALNKLKEKTGKDFDKKFLKMIIIDHKRDVKKFKKALTIGDSSTEDFASKNLPIIVKHLDAVILIKKNY